uniref:Uncharacterized protein n=1 Tax=Alexandrium monilatum TaxID=311494 RepID=A0A7S4RHK2_9DINO|mmetsp:Transcript_70553/g.210390  ORF Transcript_70553/g.210390 Transcript_70553/m.210390 type:complete len:291 (-) Transcript_70553:431-1303(-)
MSDVGSAVLHGDSSRRVTVPLPRSLPELQYHANRHFSGGKGNARMYHHGHSKVQHAHHMGKIKDGDVIVIEGMRSMPEPPMYTTHRTDYVPHELEVRPPPPPAERPPPGARFDGVTSYNQAYVKHPPGYREPVRPPKSGLASGSHGVTGKSMYSTQYPWRNVEPQRPVLPSNGMPLGSTQFEGVTSYMNDYVGHPVRARSAAPVSKSRGPSLPFEAKTTYADDYQNTSSARTVTAVPHKATLRPEGAPFEGNTEYKREYVELAQERRPLVHLEPEIGRTSRGLSTPARRR